MLKVFLPLIISSTVLIACGGGGDSAPAPVQLYTCSGLVLPGTNLVGGACVPITGTTTTNPYEANKNNCCKEYSYDPYSQRYSYVTIPIGGASSKGMVCTLDRAYFACGN